MMFKNNKPINVFFDNQDIKQGKGRKIEYITDVDTGEIYPIPKGTEAEALNNVPGFIKDDVTVNKVKYVGDGGVNDLVAELSDELAAEKASKTIIHKFPLLKILCAVLVSACVIVGCVFGIRYVNSIDFEPVIIQYDTYEEQETSSEIIQQKNQEQIQKEEQEHQEKQKQNTVSRFDEFVDTLSGMLLPVLSVAVAIFAVKIAIAIMKNVY